MSSNLPRKGDVWLVDFNPTRGSEISKCRPAVVISADDIGMLPLKIVVPVTDWKPHYEHAEWFTHLSASLKNGLSKESGADGFQVKSVSLDRFNERLGEVDEDDLSIILNTVALCIGI
ncbi:MAG: type II toxin-antitoxin system PemK/MazF family toxin [Kiritimatiellales bacterium]|jgi:mRNA interferase MazF